MHAIVLWCATMGVPLRLRLLALGDLHGFPPVEDGPFGEDYYPDIYVRTTLIGKNGAIQLVKSLGFEQSHRAAATLYSRDTLFHRRWPFKST